MSKRGAILMCHWILIPAGLLQFLCSNQFFVVILTTRSLLKLAARSRNLQLSSTALTLLFYCMEKNTSWDVNRSSASQEIPHILWNPTFHYLIQKCPQPVPVLSQNNPVHATLSNILKIHSNITLYFYLRYTHKLISRFAHYDIYEYMPVLFTRFEVPVAGNIKS